METLCGQPRPAKHSDSNSNTSKARTKLRSDSDGYICKHGALGCQEKKKSPGSLFLHLTCLNRVQWYNFSLTTLCYHSTYSCG